MTDIKIEKILLSSQEIEQRVVQLAGDISRDYEGREILMVPILQGSKVFSDDLAGRLKVKYKSEPIRVSSYSGTQQDKTIELVDDIKTDPAGKDVLLVEDIADTGHTLKFLQDYFTNRKAATLRTCVLLDKPLSRKIHVDIAYRGFTIPDEFVVGYGLDYCGNYRELPYIGILHAAEKIT